MLLFSFINPSIQTMPLSVFYTKEGSTTLINQELDETYHSRIGAIQEAEHVFIRMGLEEFKQRKPTRITIFEMGYGTGLNAWRTSIWAIKNQIKVDYYTIEKYPLEQTIIEQLNYKSFTLEEEEKVFFDQIHDCEWEIWCDVNPFFRINKSEMDINHLKVSSFSQNFDICFFDGFAPNKQPEVWEPNILQKIYAILKDKGLLTTYCSQGQFRRNLEALGFQVNRVKGPPGKREMIQAIK